MHIASLCVGIVDYQHPAYGSNARRLRFANSDARAFSDYLKTASGGRDSAREHTLLLDEAASLINAQQALTELAERGEVELFVLYLAGHGERGDEQGGWFCLADAIPSARSLDGARLEQLLSAVRAQSVLVVVDCCHAEALLGGMRYFTSLDGGRARLFVASARTNQLAWEDAELQRSVLSDVFLRACSTASPIQSSAGSVRIESALFPYLREQVPLLASAQKHGSIQEPVTGGTARADVDLPVVDSKSFGRALTIAQTVRARLRQVLVKGTLALVLLLVGVEMLAYHVTADSAGRILVRPGLPLSHAFLPVAMVKEVDTGMRVEDLSSRSQDDTSAIAQSSLWGLASHLDARGVRPWFSRTASLLKTPTRVRSEILAVATEPTPLPEDSRPPIEQALFLSLLRNESPASVALKLYASTGSDLVECVPGRTRKFDFTILNVPSAPYALDLWWQSLQVRGAAGRADAMILHQVQNTAYRAGEAKELEDATADMWPLALSLVSLAPLTTDSGTLRQTLSAQLDTPCRAHAAIALRLFGSQRDNELAEAQLLKDLQSFDRNVQGDLPNARQAMAAHALAVMAGSRPLLDSTVDTLGAILVREDPGLERTTLSRTVLLAAASGKALPKPLLNHLFAKLDAPERLHDFGYLAALELLSRNIAFLPPDLVRRLGDWLDTNAPRLHAMNEVQAAVGFLLSVDPAPRKVLAQLLVDQLSPETYFPVPALGYRGELVIYAQGHDAAVALGRALQSRALPEDIIERLVRFAIGRKDVSERQVIIDGFATRWYSGLPKASNIQARLAAASGDARRRLLEVEVACSRLVNASAHDRSAVIGDLLSLWRVESEPELRVALAQIAARSQWPRYANMTLCAEG